MAETGGYQEVLYRMKHQKCSLSCADKHLDSEAETQAEVKERRAKINQIIKYIRNTGDSFTCAAFLSPNNALKRRGQ